MHAKHSSILIYFDNFHMVEDLPDEQLGILFRAVMESAELEVNGRNGVTGYRERYPRMGEKVQTAYQFMMGSIRRDTAAYEAKCAGRRSYAQRGWEPRKTENSRETRKEENDRELASYVRQFAARQAPREAEKNGRPDWAAR